MRQQPFASPEEALEHFGVKGMHWGVRKERAANLTGYVKEPIVRKTATGETFTLTPVKPNKVIKSLALVSDKYAQNYGMASSLKIQDKHGKKIGEAAFWLNGKEDIYLNWISIEKGARGQGYASEVMKAAAEQGKTTGRKRMVLEVPGNAPDARHIYEKMGFKPTGEVSGQKNDIWGGLTQYEYRFDHRKGASA